MLAGCTELHQPWETVPIERYSGAIEETIVVIVAAACCCCCCRHHCYVLSCLWWQLLWLPSTTTIITRIITMNLFYEWLNIGFKYCSVTIDKNNTKVVVIGRLQSPASWVTLRQPKKETLKTVSCYCWMCLEQFCEQVAWHARYSMVLRERRYNWLTFDNLLYLNQFAFSSEKGYYDHGALSAQQSVVKLCVLYLIIYLFIRFHNTVSVLYAYLMFATMSLGNKVSHIGRAIQKIFQLQQK